MKIDVISVQPKMLEGFLTESILGRAVKKGACEINLVDLRDFGEGRWKKVDDKPYGGGPGMLMKCKPWFAAVESCLSPGEATFPLLHENQPNPQASGATRKERAGELRIIMTSPSGKTFTQRDAEMFANLQPPTSNLQPHLIFLCGHYEGFDARIETLATDLYSIGDFVMTGGELAAAAMIDAIVRLLPGVLGGGPAATSNESFSLSQPSTLNPQLSTLNVQPRTLLEAPQYTHPPEFRGLKVPEVLLSGDHAKIEAWRAREARLRTERLRPDLLSPNPL